MPSLGSISEKGTILPFLAMFILFLWWAYYCVSEVIHFNKMETYLGLYILAGMLPLVFYSTTPLEDWVSWGTTIQLGFIFVVVRTTLRDQKKFRFALNMLLMGIIILSILTIMEIFGIISLGMETNETILEGQKIVRHASLAGDPNWSSFYFGVGILLTFSRLFEVKSKLMKIVFIGIIILLFYANLLTYSVGGLISLMAGFFLLFLSRISIKRIANKKVIPVLLGLFVIITMIMLNPRVKEKYEQVSNNNVMSWGSRRGATYYGAIQVISQHPIIGIGKTKFLKEVSHYFPFLFKISDKKAAHNTYLGITGESGLIGFLFFLMFLISIIVPFWRHLQLYCSRISQMLLPCLGTALVMALSLDLQRDKLFWIIIALSAASLNLSLQDKLSKRGQF